MSLVWPWSFVGVFLVYFGGVVWWPHCVDHLRFIMLEAGGLTGNLEHWQANCVLRPNSIHNDEISKKVRFSKMKYSYKRCSAEILVLLGSFQWFHLGDVICSIWGPWIWSQPCCMIPTKTRQDFQFLMPLASQTCLCNMSMKRNSFTTVQACWWWAQAASCFTAPCALNGRCGMKCPCVSADRRLALKIPAWWVMDDGHLNNKAGRLVDYAYLVHINIRHMLAAKFTRKSSIVWKLRMWMAPHGNSKVCANNKIQDRFFLGILFTTGIPYDAICCSFISFQPVASMARPIPQMSWVSF